MSETCPKECEDQLRPPLTVVRYAPEPTAMQSRFDGQAMAARLPLTLGRACCVHAAPPFVVPSASAVP